MSPIGKIFVVLNLLLAGAFLGWAGNALKTTQNWKEKYEQEQKNRTADLAKKDEEISKLNVDLNQVTEQQRQFHGERDQKAAEADGLRRELDELKSRHDALSASLKKIESTLGDYNNTIAQLNQQKDEAVQKANDAVRSADRAAQEKDSAEAAQRTAEEERKSAETRIADLEGERNQLKDEISKLETRLQVVIADTNYNRGDVEPAPRIDGYVLEVNRDLKLVVINRGSKHEVKEGYTFSIFRGSQFKGQVRINYVQDEMASGVIVGSEKSPITKGDSASTGI